MTSYQLPSRRVAYLFAALTIALLPLFFTGSYWRTNLIICALNVMLAIGLDFVLGYAGQLNLGQSAFYGIGAYASTLLIMRLGVPFWIAFDKSSMLSPRSASAVGSALTRTADCVPYTCTRLTPGTRLMRCPACVLA